MSLSTGSISFRRGPWQGHWSFDVETGVLNGAFNAKHRAPYHSFTVESASDVRFRGRDYQGRDIHVHVLGLVRWSSDAWCFDRTGNVRTAADASDEAWVIA